MRRYDTTRARNDQRGTIRQVTSTPKETTLIAVYQYMASEEGKLKVTKALTRQRLPGSFDTDIEESVLSEAARYLDRGNTIESAPGWCSARIKARSIDLARGIIRNNGMDAYKHINALDLDAIEGSKGDLEQYSSLSSDSEEAIAYLRKCILNAKCDPQNISGALTVIAALAEGAETHAECPKPISGSKPIDAACWAGLWYAHRQDCFEENGASAQRRSRGSKQIKELMRLQAEHITTYRGDA